MKERVIIGEMLQENLVLSDVYCERRSLYYRMGKFSRDWVLTRYPKACKG